MIGSYSRVTVVGEARTVDLALPSELPIADILPQILRFTVTGEESGTGEPTAWTLSRLGGMPLSWAQSLADVGVGDGDILELRPRAAELRPAMVEDVRDAVEDDVEAAGGVWTTATTRSAVALGGTAVLVVAGVGSLVADVPRGATDLLPAAIAFVVLVGLAAWASRFARPVDARLAAAAAMAWAVPLGTDVVGRLVDLTPTPPTWWVAAAVSVGVAGALVRLASPHATGHAAAGAVVAVAGLVLAGVAAVGWPALQAVRVLPVLAILAVGAAPKLSLSAGGLAGADYRVRHAGTMTVGQLRARYRTSNDLLVGFLVGLAVVVAVAGSALDLSGAGWDRYLAVAVGVAALLRSRVFSRISHLLPLRVAAVVVGAVALVPRHQDWLAVSVLAAAVVAAVALATVNLGEIHRARVKRTLNTLEFVVIVVLVVVAAGALGVYDLVGGLFT